MYPGWSLRGWRAVGVGASRVGFGPLASFTSPYARAHDARTHPQKVCALRARSPPSRSPSRDGGERRNGCNCQVRQDASPRDLGTRRKSATAMGANLAVACRTSPAWSCRQVAHTPDRGRPPPPWSTPTSAAAAAAAAAAKRTSEAGWHGGKVCGRPQDSTDEKVESCQRKNAWTRTCCRPSASARPSRTGNARAVVWQI